MIHPFVKTFFAFLSVLVVVYITTKELSYSIALASLFVFGRFLSGSMKSYHDDYNDHQKDYH